MGRSIQARTASCASGPAEEQGARAARLALDLLGGDPPREPHLTVPTHFVIRATTGPPDQDPVPG